MPKPFFLVFIMLIIACKQKETTAQKVAESKIVKQNLSTHKTISAVKTADTVLSITNSIVDDRHFSVYRTKENTYVINSKRDTVFRDSVYCYEAVFDDFDKDGYKDIKVKYVTNVPDIEDLLLYDKREKTFKKVVGFDEFPAAVKIAGTKYYYSYHRSGCADMTWTSDLFYIKNFKSVKVGTIWGRECGNRDIKDGVYIYKIVAGKEIKIKQLNIKIIYKYKDYKWGFIKNYWYENYKLFF